MSKIFGKKDDFDLNSAPYKPLTAAELGVPELETPQGMNIAEGPDIPEPTMSPMSKFQPQPLGQQVQQSMPNRDVELILSKLDTILSTLKNLEMRVTKIEAIAAGTTQEQDKGYRW